jgi:hypothetical protein
MSDERRRQDMNSKFGWNPKVGDRVEGVGPHGGTGHIGTVVEKRHYGYVIEWDKGGRSVHQSYGFQKVVVGSLTCTTCKGYGAILLPYAQWTPSISDEYAAGADAPEIACPECGGSGEVA